MKVWYTSTNLSASRSKVKVKVKGCCLSLSTINFQWEHFLSILNFKGSRKISYVCMQNLINMTHRVPTACNYKINTMHSFFNGRFSRDFGYPALSYLFKTFVNHQWNIPKHLLTTNELCKKNSKTLELCGQFVNPQRKMPNPSETVELRRQFVNHKCKIPNHSKTDTKRFQKIGFNWYLFFSKKMFKPHIII